VPDLVRFVDVDRPVGQVFDAWSRIEDLPEILPGVASVRRLDERSSHWVVVVARERREFGAVVIDQLPDARISWQSRSGTPQHEGAVIFRPLDPGRTRVSVELSWEPGGLFDRIGQRLGLVARQVQKDLDAFKRHVETSPPVEGDRAAIGIDAGAGTASTPADGVVDAAAASFDDGRGRTADSPTEIPPRGWMDILKRAFAQVKSDNVPVVAGGVAFYIFLSLVPALLAVILVYGLVADPNDVRRQLSEYLTALPTDARDLILRQLQAVTQQEAGGLGVGLVASVLAAIYSASKGMQGLIAALNVAYDEEETRKFVKLRLTTLGLTLAVIVGGAAGVGGMALLGSVAEDLGTAGGITLTILRWPLLAAFLIFGLAALYRYAPDRDRAKWRWVTPGAIVATVLWVIGSVAFSIYANVAGKFQETYGALGQVAVLLLWLLLSAYSIILGAELDAEAERQTTRDSTKGPRSPLGQRDAYAADTVAPAPTAKR
jgi:membrane protein